MNYECYIQDAIDMVSAWEIPEEDFARAVNDQARLMAGQGLEPSGNDLIPIIHTYPHQ